MREQAYHLCCQYMGQSVRIVCKCGTDYYGSIQKVDNEKVYIQPYTNQGGRWFIGPALVGLALGSIAGIALTRPPCYGCAPYPYPAQYPYPYY